MCTFNYNLNIICHVPLAVFMIGFIIPALPDCCSTRKNLQKVWNWHSIVVKIVLLVQDARTVTSKLAKQEKMFSKQKSPNRSENAVARWYINLILGTKWYILLDWYATSLRFALKVANDESSLLQWCHFWLLVLSQLQLHNILINKQQND